MTSKLEHALALAREGFYIFRLAPNTSLPLKDINWRDASTINLETITKWFTCDVTGWDQDYNIGVDCYKSGVTAIDIDVKDGKEGLASYKALEAEFGWSETRVQKTPSGGYHLIFKAQGFKNSVCKLAPGIDVRGDGGYYAAAGSSKPNGDYTLLKDIAPKPLPAWLEEKLTALGKAVPPSSRASGDTIIEDDAGDIAYAIEFLQNHPPSVDGDAGDNATYVAFCHLKERGISIETAIELALEHWNPNCSPPWDEPELRTKAENAYRYAQNATGAKSPHAEFDIPKSDYGVKPEEPKAISRFNEGFLLPDALSFPPRDWVYGKLALAKNVTLIIAPPGVGKSTLTLGIALSKASGKDIFDIDPLGKGAVAIFNNEDNLEEQARRLVAASIFNEITNADISDAIDGSRLLLNGRDNAPLTIAKRNKHGAIVAHQAKELTEYLIKNNVKLLIVDPFAMTHPADENRNEEMLIVGNLYAEVANRANCAVVLVHHTRKLNQASSEGHNGNLDSARGASSLGGVVRVAYTLNVMSKADAKRHGIEEDQRLKYLLLEQAKANMSAPGEHQMYFERIGVPVGQDNESVGVLKHVTLSAAATRNDSVIDLIKALEEVCPGRNLTISNAAISVVQLAEFIDKQPDTIEKRIRKLLSSGELTGINYFIELKDDAVKGRKAKVIVTRPLTNGLRLIDSGD